MNKRVKHHYFKCIYKICYRYDYASYRCVYVRLAHLGTIKPFQIESPRLNNYKSAGSQISQKQKMIHNKTTHWTLTGCSISEWTVLDKDLHKGKRLFYKCWFTMVTYTQEVGDDVGWKLWMLGRATRPLKGQHNLLFKSILYTSTA